MMIDWTLVRQIAADTWGVTVLVCTIGWLVAGILGLVIRKAIKTTTAGKEGSGKG